LNLPLPIYIGLLLPIFNLSDGNLYEFWTAYRPTTQLNFLPTLPYID